MLNRISWYTTDRVVRFHEILFSLNLAFALLLPWVIFSLTFIDAGPGADLYSADSYLFQRTAIRLSSFFPHGGAPGVAAEITYAATLISCAALLWVVLHVLGQTPLRWALLKEFAGMAAVFGVPLSLLYVIQVRWNLTQESSFWNVVWIKCVAAEVVCFGLLLFLRKKRRFSLWAISFLLLLHYGGWSFVLWPKVSHLMMLLPWGSLSLVHILVSPTIFASAFPLSGLAWLLYMGQAEENLRQTPRLGSAKAVVASGLLAVALLLVIWWPVRGYSISHSGKIKSLRVTMERTSCFGSCPVYSVTVTGDGAVKYMGTQFVAVKGRQTAVLSSEQVAALAKDLDQIDFFTLEDRAFLYCIDTPRVSIAVLIDGRLKTVSSDSACVGRKSGAQAQFVKLTEAFDDLVDSRKWTACANRHCRP